MHVDFYIVLWCLKCNKLSKWGILQLAQFFLGQLDVNIFLIESELLLLVNRISIKLTLNKGLYNYLKKIFFYIYFCKIYLSLIFVMIVQG